ncbi:MAG: EAL domain-containing protein [Phenylobacterium sp.]|uniref:EAL domain-containing protein n=1 Tax=Phenylobacterium sp. TaxID=1871053 RepID=UPI00391DE5A8
MASLLAGAYGEVRLQLGSQRLLGLAFASADLLIEIAPDGRIAFAVGAGEALSGAAETELVGRNWRDFIDPLDRTMVEALLEGLKDGGRGGPVVVVLPAGKDGAPRAASLCAFRMPGNNGAVSCAFTRAAAQSTHGLHDRATFETVTTNLFETAKATGLELELALVELAGLDHVRRMLGPDALKDLELRLTGALRAQSHGGSAAADLGDDRYALVRQRGESVDAMTDRLMSLLPLDGAGDLHTSAQAIALAGDVAPAQALRAIRYSLEAFIKDGAAGTAPASLGEAVSQSLKRTLTDVGALGEAVNGRNFRLVYQPVVDLKDGGRLHHHEVLVRFGDNGSPFPMIRMAEELDLIEPLDLAVVEQTIEVLAGDPSLKLAANVSGRTICSPGFVEAVRGMLAAHPGAAERLLLEITESAAIEDLPVADRHLRALRALGVQACLDDFGAGAASLAYLQQLTLDLVKIDGRYIRELQHGGRESAFIRHLVTMCSELGVRTVAEMVENAQSEEAVRRAGVDFAQGWRYGAPAERPEQPISSAVSPNKVRPAMRRAGAAESWG